MSVHRTLMRPVISTARATPASMRFASTSSQQTLTWPEYLNLRHKRRLISTITSVPTTIAAFFGGAMYFGNLDMDPSQPIFEIEPMFVYGGATIGCAGLGYLIGPTVGALMFKAVNGSRSKAIEVMDKRFYDHIKARRVDPSYQSLNNPTPDYYGEKISSFKTYRRWLRDQSAYRRKALHGMKEVDGELI